MLIPRYDDYEDLKNKALTPTASQEDINNLLDWFFIYGGRYYHKRGQYYKRDKFKLYLPTERYPARLAYKFNFKKFKKGS